MSSFFDALLMLRALTDFEKQQQRVEVQFSCHELRSSGLGLQTRQAHSIVPSMEQ